MIIDEFNEKTEKRTHNIRFAKVGGSYFYDSGVLNSSLLHLIKFSAENPHLRKSANRYLQATDTESDYLFCINKKIAV